MQENQARRALLIVDLQQDFVSPNGPFKDKYVKIDHIVSHLNNILPRFRDSNGIVVWIKANYKNDQTESKFLARPEGKQYENIPMNDTFLSGTHRSFPLCVTGTDGERFPPEVISLIKSEEDFIVTKTYYSAFTNTNLADILKNVSEVHICGLLSNVCVQATTIDAFFHGYKVFVWIDCLGYRNEVSHRTALKKIRRWYATTIVSNQFSDQQVITADSAILKPVLYFANGCIPSSRVMMALYEKDIDFEGKRLQVMSKPKRTKSAEFLAINPRGLTPTFVDKDGTIIAESLAILYYLEEYFPSTRSLLPIEKAKHVQVMQRVQESQNLVDIYESLEAIVFKTLEHEHLSRKKSIIETLEKINEELTFWEMYLTKNTFIACDQFTLADCAFYPVIAYLIHRGLDVHMFSRLKEYVNMIKMKPAAINSHPSDWTEKDEKINIFQVVHQIILDCNNKAV